MTNDLKFPYSESNCLIWFVCEKCFKECSKVLATRRRLYEQRSNFPGIISPLNREHYIEYT